MATAYEIIVAHVLVEHTSSPVVMAGPHHYAVDDVSVEFIQKRINFHWRGICLSSVQDASLEYAVRWIKKYLELSDFCESLFTRIVVEFPSCHVNMRGGVLYFVCGRVVFNLLPEVGWPLCLFVDGLYLKMSDSLDELFELALSVE